MPRNWRKLNSVCLILMLVLLLFLLSNKRKKYDVRNDVLPVLVMMMTCDRTYYLKRCLESLVRYRPDSSIYPIIVSQDCCHEETLQIIKSFADIDPTITFIEQPADQSDILGHNAAAHLKGYYKIARRYRFALNHVFRTLQHKAVIVLEDNLDISPDFYEYFRGTYPLLYQDPTIWCVSAWNDNCKKDLVDIKETELLHRTDFFPGLGWMVLSKTWEELELNWPEAYLIDDWLRVPAISRGRVCIRPEISRTFKFGRVGVSNPYLFDRHLRHMVVNKDFIPFTKYNLSYLLKKNEHMFFSFVYSLPEATDEEVMAGTLNSSLKFIQVPFTNINNFRKSAAMFGLMDDLRHGVPRTGLRGVVQCFIKGRRVFLVPKIKIVQSSVLPVLNYQEFY
ncbi:alpha-1,3-mannosyl-glycoprotein 2-beta-N-acetylglucosaminyltransferase-like [Cydia fagiglandana]|uniref:alpha-1,3-mannosyl-glycoprotein 2-beta-N-acetylglucosaminyltransferase-like n=1 Tax=Cydia fagiglandana TaxID=1458189 RepID=UPI002FEDFB92